MGNNSKNTSQPPPPASAKEMKLITLAVPTRLAERIVTETAQVEFELLEVEGKMSAAAQELAQARQMHRDAQLILAKSEIAMLKAERKHTEAEHTIKLLQLRATDADLQYDALVFANGHDAKNRQKGLSPQGEIIVLA